VKVRQTVGKLRRRHGLVMSGEPREPGYRVTDWLWEAKRVRSTIGRGPTSRLQKYSPAHPSGEGPQPRSRYVRLPSSDRIIPANHE